MLKRLRGLLNPSDSTRMAIALSILGAFGTMLVRRVVREARRVKSGILRRRKAIEEGRLEADIFGRTHERKDK